MEVGGWVQVSWNFFKIVPKLSYTSTINVLYTICILCVNTLLKVVSNYDLSFLSMAMMGFQKKVRIV